MKTAKRILHPVMRLWIKCVTYFFFEDITITGRENILKKGPVILASNHPDAFLDALLLTSYYNKPIYYLARGDVFSGPFVSALLRFMNIVPVFRKEEGTENLSKNDATFSFCIDVLREDGTILIFSEGGSHNKWELRTLRKGTARLAYNSWKDEKAGMELKVVPVAINYSSWLSMNNRAYISFLEPIERKDIPVDLEQAVWLKQFNTLLKRRLESQCLILDTAENNEEQKLLTAFFLKNFKNGREMAAKAIEGLKEPGVKEELSKLINYLKKENIHYYRKVNILGFLFGIITFDLAFMLNVIPYSICKRISARSTKYDEFFDSVFFCIILFIYPVYLGLLFLTIYFVSHSCLFGLAGITITLILAKLSEWGKGNIQSYIKRKHYANLTKMISVIFGTNNG